MSRRNTAVETYKFIVNHTVYEECIGRLKKILDDAQLDLTWPRTPGTGFCYYSDNSALFVAYQFVIGVNTASLVGRNDVANAGTTTYDQLAVYPEPHVRFIAWRDRTMNELIAHTLPLLPNRPVWEITRDA